MNDAWIEQYLSSLPTSNTDYLGDSAQDYGADPDQWLSDVVSGTQQQTAVRPVSDTSGTAGGSSGGSSGGTTGGSSSGSGGGTAGGSGGTNTGSTGYDLFRAFLANPSMEAFNAFMRSGAGMGSAVGLMALLAATNRAGKSGGGYTGLASPTPTNRTMVQGKYGPIAQYAAQGGLMHAYAHGGAVTGTHRNPLRMEDGGFVMTKRAVDGAGGPRGIAQMLPGARPIVGPGTGTSDHIPATIDGRTPARVSNGEAYVPKRVVNQAGGAKALYALMNQLQRRA